jgi:hypothetical protein
MKTTCEHGTFKYGKCSECLDRDNISESTGTPGYADKYENHRFSKFCPTCGQQFYKEAFEAAKAFIDSHVADPDISSEMCDRYAEYLEAIKRLDALQL